MCLAWIESFVSDAFQPAVGTGDWKVALTRTLESVRYVKQIRNAGLFSVVPAGRRRSNPSGSGFPNPQQVERNEVAEVS